MQFLLEFTWFLELNWQVNRINSRSRQVTYNNTTIFTPTPLYCLLLLLSYIYQRLWRVSEEEESDTGSVWSDEGESDTGSVSSDEGVGDMAEERSLELE